MISHPFDNLPADKCPCCRTIAPGCIWEPRMELCFYCGSDRLEWYEEWPDYPEVSGRDFKQVCLCCGREDYV